MLSTGIEHYPYEKDRRQYTDCRRSFKFKEEVRCRMTDYQDPFLSD